MAATLSPFADPDGGGRRTHLPTPDIVRRLAYVVSSAAFAITLSLYISSLPPSLPFALIFCFAGENSIQNQQPTSPAASSLRRGDVLMKVDGIKVANDGSIPFRSGERVALRYYMSQLFSGDKARGRWYPAARQADAFDGRCAYGPCVSVSPVPSSSRLSRAPREPPVKTPEKLKCYRLTRALYPPPPPPPRKGCAVNGQMTKASNT